MQCGDSIVDRGQGWKRHVGLGLIPICDGRKIVRAMIGVAVFDGGTHVLCKWDGRVEMKAVDTAAGAGLLLADDWSAVKLVREGVTEVPGSEEVVFAARAGDCGGYFVVDKEHVVSFAPPAVLVLEHGHSYAYIVSLAFGLEPDVIVVAGWVAL